MNNHYFFSEEELDLLTTFSKWRLIATGSAEEHAVVPPEDYCRWVNRSSHQHPYREMFFVLSGVTFSSLNGKTYRCEPGTLFLIEAGEIHDFFYPPSTGDFRHIWFGQARNTIIMRAVYSYQNGKVQNDNTGGITCRDHSGLSFIGKWDKFKSLAATNPPFAVLLMKYAWGNLITELCREGFLGPSDQDAENECRKIITAVADHIRDKIGRAHV